MPANDTSTLPPTVTRHETISSSILCRYDAYPDFRLVLDVLGLDPARAVPRQHVILPTRRRQPDRERVRVKVLVRLAIDPDLIDSDASRREQVRRDAQGI